MTKVFVRNPYNYDTMEASNASGLECLDPSKAQQNMRDECDINTILKRFAITGELPQGVRMPEYGDFTAATDYQSALNAVMAANESFAAMPAEIRTRFNNDAAAFVDFCADANNLDEAIKLGLVPSKGSLGEPSNPAPEGGGVAQSST